eukprot:CAMPEP_0194750394 /NCGR_PEP_ID=MMETSP0323_2-20130528/4452_1 /TAXON_ID=2866 ORGANISM="Crypthecodinium cohnii, Strain Seligo" /NCGR_SAMPLE_ID=MMETSP0323_2 /ASSEMBLY_ACC=CAM_ASM_000346 /LENGTH=111 /DNA_ID=CAMNT_0039666065 /DNA_START=249 /DNA_END=584 /DNA_ORIENTATION=-
MTYWLVFSDACDPDKDEAWLCGALRSSSYLLVTASVLLQAYVLWVIWSFCEDIHVGRNGWELWELLPSKDQLVKKWRYQQDGPTSDIIGFALSKLPGAYGTLHEEEPGFLG